MRPQILFPLFAPLAGLPRMGPKLAPLVARAAGGERILDLVWHRPVALVDRRTTPPVAEARDGEIATLVVAIERHLPPRRPSLPYRIRCRDESGALTLVFFRASAERLATQFPEGSQRVVSGRVERFRDEVQMAHPDHSGPVEALARIAIVEPVYGLTAGVYTKDEAAARGLLAQVNAGTVYWNCCDRVSPRLPWSGVGDSGIGLTLSTYGIQTFTRPKAWHLRQPG